MGNIYIKMWLLCLMLMGAMPSIAQSLSMEYWFDQRFGERKTVQLNGTETVTVNAATNRLDVGLHWLYMRVKDSDGIYSSITASPFMKCNHPMNGNSFEYWIDDDFDNVQTMPINVSGGATNLTLMLDMGDVPLGVHRLNYRIVTKGGKVNPVYSTFFIHTGDVEPNRLEYWIDDDFDNLQTMPINVSGGVTTFTFLLDMGEVPIGVHRLNYRIVTKSGRVKPLSTAFFFHAGDGEPNRLEYWIDDDVKHSRFAEGATTTDSCIILVNDLDLNDVPIGLHRLNFRVLSANNRRLSPPSMAFIMVGGTKEPLMEFWLDDDIANSRTMPMTRYGSSFVADGLLDLSDADKGLHRLNYRVASADKRYIGTTNTSMVLISAFPDNFAFTRLDETEIVKGVYWVDDQDPVPFTDFEPGMEVNIEELVNLASLEDGEHVLSMKFMDSNGRWTDIDHTIFMKAVLENTVCIAGILYEYHSNQGKPYVTVIGYEDDITEVKVLPKVQFGNKELVVTNIDPKAFYGCNTVGEIASLPATMTSIGEEAFATTSVNEVRLAAETAPTIGNDAFPRGTNLRVPVDGKGYHAFSSLFEQDSIRLTYDYGCIYDDQWAALKRIDKMVSERGGNTGWDFTDRAATPAGISRWGDDNVCEIDLSYHNLTGAYDSGEWTEGLPKISRINLIGNSILDMTGKDNYHIMRLDSQRYDLVTDVRVSDPNVEQLRTPEIPLIFRDANTGEIGNPGNHHVTYSLNTMTPDSVYTDDNHESYGILLNVTPNGDVSLSQTSGNPSNVYHGKSGDVLSVTSSGNHTITPGSYFKTHLYFDEGDVDINGEVDVADLQSVINHIFDYGDKKNIFAWYAANLAIDDIINVQDVVGVVGILVNQVPENDNAHNSRRKAATVTDDENEVYDAVLTLSDEGLILRSEHDVAALDLVVTKGVDLTELKGMGMIISSKTMADGREHIVAYSLSGRVIPAGEHVIATNTAGKRLSSAKLADLEANRLNTSIINLADQLTGIEEVNSQDTDEDRLYDVSGRRVRKSYRGIVIQKGKTRISNLSK
ncbi:MAG: leucine-rich repeat protein [Prevotella sp.]|nr:leucine-rich repeat protein [Prevotella sp.]